MVTVAFGSVNPASPSGGSDATLNEQIVEGTLTLSANYGTGSSHGDAMDLGANIVKSQQVPRRVEIFEEPAAGSAPLGYTYIYAAGTTIHNGQLVVLGTPATGAATTGLTEFTQGSAYSGGTPSLAAAVLRFRAWFDKFI